MADIRDGLNGIKEPDRSIGLLLCDFHWNMKALESDPHRGGKQAVAIIMAMNDIMELIDAREVIRRAIAKLESTGDIKQAISILRTAL